jgi:ketosteroid isomerase-like protein
MRTIAAFGLIAILTLSGCERKDENSISTTDTARPSAAPITDLSAIRQIIIRNQIDIGKHINDGRDSSMVAKFYRSDAKLLVPGEPFMSGHADLFKFWRNATASLKGLERVTVSCEGNDQVVYETGIATAIYEVKGKKNSTTYKYMTIWTNINNSWLIAADTWNSLPEMPE